LKVSPTTISRIKRKVSTEAVLNGKVPQRQQKLDDLAKLIEEKPDASNREIGKELGACPSNGHLMLEESGQV